MTEPEPGKSMRIRALSDTDMSERDRVEFNVEEVVGVVGAEDREVAEGVGVGDGESWVDTDKVDDFLREERAGGGGRETGGTDDARGGGVRCEYG